MLLISSDMPELIALADRALVMNAFRAVTTLANSHDYAAMSQAILAHIRTGVAAA